MVFHGKKYQLVSSENFDEFLKVIGVDPACRKAVENMKATLELRQEGDSYAFGIASPFKNNETKFKLGQEIHEERVDGVKVKSIIDLEGNKMKHVQKCPDGLEITYIREFGPEEMKAVATANNVTCTRLYKAI